MLRQYVFRHHVLELRTGILFLPTIFFDKESHLDTEADLGHSWGNRAQTRKASDDSR